MLKMTVCMLPLTLYSVIRGKKKTTKTENERQFEIACLMFIANRKKE